LTTPDISPKAQALIIAMMKSGEGGTDGKRKTRAYFDKLTDEAFNELWRKAGLK